MACFEPSLRVTEIRLFCFALHKNSLKMAKNKEKNEDLNYETAHAELEKILEDLQNEAVGMDVLGEKIRRAAELIQFCKTRLRQTEDEISKILN
jgi:exodeoxyribonuclease VII small subunit